jgi:hypothetical protein
MQFLVFFIVLWFFLTRGYSYFNLFQSPDIDIFADIELESMFSSNENNLEETSSYDQMMEIDPYLFSIDDNFESDRSFESDSNWLFDDTSEFDQVTEFDPSSSYLLAGDIACSVADDIQLQGKHRRQNYCSVPRKPKKPKKPNPQGPPEPYQFFTPEIAKFSIFGEWFDICPKEIFLTSNTPVCKEGSPAPGESYSQYGQRQSWMHLYGVEPCTSMKMI